MRLKDRRGVLAVGWRLGLTAGGAALLAAAMANAASGSTSWWVFWVGVAGGACVGVVAVCWPEGGLRSAGAHNAQALLYGCLALLAVVMLVGRYGAATGAFLLLIGAYALARRGAARR